MISKKTYIIWVIIIIAAVMINSYFFGYYNSPEEALSKRYSDIPKAAIKFDEIHVEPDISIILSFYYDKAFKRDIIWGYFFISKKILGNEKWKLINNRKSEDFPGEWDWDKSDGITYREMQFPVQYMKYFKKNAVILDSVIVSGDDNITEIAKFSKYKKLEPEIHRGNDTYAIWYDPCLKATEPYTSANTFYLLYFLIKIFTGHI